MEKDLQRLNLTRVRVWHVWLSASFQSCSCCAWRSAVEAAFTNKTRIQIQIQNDFDGRRLFLKLGDALRCRGKLLRQDVPQRACKARLSPSAHASCCSVAEPVRAASSSALARGFTGMTRQY